VTTPGFTVSHVKGGRRLGSKFTSFPREVTSLARPSRSSDSAQSQPRFSRSRCPTDASSMAWRNSADPGNLVRAAEHWPARRSAAVEAARSTPCCGSSAWATSGADPPLAQLTAEHLRDSWSGSRPCKYPAYDRTSATTARRAAALAASFTSMITKRPNESTAGMSAEPALSLTSRLPRSVPAPRPAAAHVAPSRPDRATRPMLQPAVAPASPTCSTSGPPNRSTSTARTTTPFPSDLLGTNRPRGRGPA